MVKSAPPLREWLETARKFKSCPPRHAILAFEIIKLTFVGFSADAGTAAVGVFFCELRAYVCGLRSGEGRCVGPLFFIVLSNLKLFA